MMKKTISITIGFLMVFAMFLMLALTVKADDTTTLFYDDFEAYAVDSFPNSGGWELVWNGKGTGYQVVTDVVSHSPNKSLQLWGQSGRSANIQKEFTSSSEIIAFEAYVSTDEITGTAWKVASLCFWNLEGLTWGKRFADVAFGPDGEMYTRPVSGEPYISLGVRYEARQWYKINVVIHRDAGTYNVWVDDVLAAQNVGIWDTYEIDALMLESGHTSVKAYFDDVNILEGAQVVGACVDVNPNALNLWSNGKWITAYIELSESYDVADIDVSSILLNDSVPAEATPTCIGDYDGDGVPDLMVKFSRAEVEACIIGALGTLTEPTWVTLTITGNLKDGTAFTGSDTIRVMCKGGGGPGKTVLMR